MTVPGFSIPPHPDDFSREVFFLTSTAAEPLTGSRTRAFHTIRALCALGCRVHHFYLRANTEPTPRLDALAASCPRFRHSLRAIINLETNGVLWLSDLWSCPPLQSAMEYVTHLAPARDRWRIVADLSDVLLDDATAKTNRDEKQLAELRALEGALLRAADVAVWVSAKEKRRAIELYGVNPGKARVIASFHESPPSASARGFADRQANVCLAGSAHPHNVRALKVGIKTVWPLIFAGQPTTELHIFGSGVDRVLAQRPPQGSRPSPIRILGFVESFIEKLSDYRVHLIPTVSGVGVKTKVFDSLAAGTPVVATAAALEGTGLDPGDAVFVSNAPEALAARSLQLLTDAPTWARAHAEALVMAARHADFPGFCDTVREVLRALPAPLRAASTQGGPGIAAADGDDEQRLRPTILISTHHKTGTMLAKRIFKQIASRGGLSFLDLAKAREAAGRWDIVFDMYARCDQTISAAPAAGVHFIRDPRMVVVSSALYHVHSSEAWLHLPRPDFDGLTYQEKIRSLGSDRERFLFEMDHVAGSVVRDMARRVAEGYPWCMNLKLEDLMTDYRLEAYTRMFRHLGFAGDLFNDALEVAYEHSVFNPALGNTAHIRSREIEPWQKYYDPALHDIFTEKFADACQILGYD